jgi:hypothetical protein
VETDTQEALVKKGMVRSNRLEVLSRDLELDPSGYGELDMEIFAIDDAGYVHLSPAVDDWEPIESRGISAVIDLDGDLDIGVPSVPDHMLYIYFPIYDEDLPDLVKLHGIARLGAELVRSGHKVLSHCGMGLNRSALVAGLILTNLGMSGKDAVELIRSKRPGALFNETFEAYLLSIDASQVSTAFTSLRNP